MGRARGSGHVEVHRARAIRAGSECIDVGAIGCGRDVDEMSSERTVVIEALIDSELTLAEAEATTSIAAVRTNVYSSPELDGRG